MTIPPTPPPKKYNLRETRHWQKRAARAEYLRHPDASISEVAKTLGIADRTVARAREGLVREGLLAPGRNSTIGAADAMALAMNVKRTKSSEPPDTGESPEPPEAGPEPVRETPLSAQPGHTTKRGSKSSETIDGEALRQMNEMLDGLADEDDETTRKKLLRQVKRFAFDPNLHPDTRMSASQLWAKLLDMSRAKDLGPGIPLTLADAIVRATEFCRVAGAKVMVPAFYAAFDLGDVPDGKPTPAVEQNQSPPAIAETPGPTDHNA